MYTELSQDHSIAVAVSAYMKLLLEASKLLDNEKPSTAQFFELMRLRDQARGEESARIGALVEIFINNAPPDVLLEISKVSLGV